MPETVHAADAKGFNMTILQIFGMGPKWTITCGKCRCTFEKRLPLVDEPGVPCPSCGTINIIPVEWATGED